MPVVSQSRRKVAHKTCTYLLQGRHRRCRVRPHPGRQAGGHQCALRRGPENRGRGAGRPGVVGCGGRHFFLAHARIGDHDAARRTSAPPPTRAPRTKAPRGRGPDRRPRQCRDTARGPRRRGQRAEPRSAVARRPCAAAAQGDGQDARPVCAAAPPRPVRYEAIGRVAGGADRPAHAHAGRLALQEARQKDTDHAAHAAAHVAQPVKQRGARPRRRRAGRHRAPDGAQRYVLCLTQS